ncbi:MAG: FAD-dependent monooxygenase [Burkholderiaceae bacterium]|jgi:salicylate hydroxylase|nr:FAD-dependent monooxygenase [Burkholderiaceae bacterium]
MSEQILIAGGGIGGLAAALASAHAGWDVRLYERAAAFSEVGAGIQLGPNSVRCLQAWGLQKPLQAVAAFPDKLQVRSAVHGNTLAELPLGASAVARYGAAYATVHRADLHGVLLQALGGQPRVHLHSGCAIERFSEREGFVQIRTTRGREIEGDALLGADGLWSTVRQQLLADGPPRFCGHLAYRALVRQGGLPRRLRTAQVTAWLGPKLHAVQYPVRRGEMQNLVVIVHGTAPADLQNWDHSAQAADLHGALEGTCSALQDAVGAVAHSRGQWRLWPLCDRAPLRGPADMARGQVALLGDAAHPMRPYLAQGAGMAIEDAWELQRALAMQDLELSLRLRRYALNRWQRNARVQARSARNGAIFHATGALRWGRDTALRWWGPRLLDLPWLYGAGWH